MPSSRSNRKKLERDSKKGDRNLHQRRNFLRMIQTPNRIHLARARAQARAQAQAKARIEADITHRERKRKQEKTAGLTAAVRIRSSGKTRDVDLL